MLLVRQSLGCFPKAISLITPPSFMTYEKLTRHGSYALRATISDFIRELE